MSTENMVLGSGSPGPLRVELDGRKFEAVAVRSKSGEELMMRVTDAPSINLRQIGSLVLVERSAPRPLAQRPDQREVRAAIAGEDTELMVVTLVLAPVPAGG